MQDLDRDLKDAFNLILIGNYKERVIGVCKYLDRHMEFTHASFKTFTRDDAWGVLLESFSQRALFGACYVILSIFKPLYVMLCDIGIYQLWGTNNRGIGIDYLSIIADEKQNSVLIDLVEHCHVWWIPSFKGVQKIRLFTSMDLIDTKDGKKILRQHDHTLVAETFLYHQYPKLGEIASKHVLPTVGNVVSTTGNWLYKHLNDKEVIPKLERPLLIDPESTIPRAMEVVFGSSPSRRYALVHSSFTPDAYYYNTWMTVIGPEQIFGVLNSWVVMNSKNEMMIERAWPCGNKFLMDSEQHTILLSSLQRAFVETVCCICRVMLKSKVEVKLSRAMMNSKIEIKIERVVPCCNKILVDCEQRFSPWFWPSALLNPLGWQHHVIMTTVDNPAGGKLISRVENHVIWLEPLLKYNLGPFSWLYERMRPVTGKVFGAAGRAIYHTLEWWNSSEVAERVAQHIPNGIATKLDGLTKHH